MKMKAVILASSIVVMSLLSACSDGKSNNNASENNVSAIDKANERAKLEALGKQKPKEIPKIERLDNFRVTIKEGELSPEVKEKVNVLNGLETMVANEGTNSQRLALVRLYMKGVEDGWIDISKTNEEMMKDKVLYLLTPSADMDYPLAQNYLAIMHLSLETPEDLKKAYIYANLAATNPYLKDVSSFAMIKWMENNLTPEQIAVAKKDVELWIKANRKNT